MINVYNKHKYRVQSILRCVILFCFIGIAAGITQGCQNSEKVNTDKPDTVESETKKDTTEDKVEETPTNTVVSGELKVHYIDVGQADAILIQQGTEAMIIDGGNNEDEGIINSYLNNLGIKELKYVIGTHPHEDHIGSLDYIINSFKVGKVYFPKQTSTTKTFESFVGAVSNSGLKLTAPSVGDTFMLGEAKCTVLAPNGSGYSDDNDYSIVVKVEYGSTSFLFTGDAEATSEMEMVKKGLNLKADVLKVGHHGSKSSTCANFLSAVNPKYAVVSVGKDNSYSHPNQGTMDRLKGAGVQVYRTDENSNIVATSNGTDISFNTSPGSYNGIASGSGESDSNGSSPKPNESGSGNGITTNEPAAADKIVYWTPGGKSYHSTNSCSTLSRSKVIESGP